MLDEKSLRKPGFADGVAVVLADGQTWVFPRPVVRTAVADDNDMGFRLLARVGGDEAYGDLYNAWFAARTVGETLRTEHALARALIQTNYDLTTAQVADLVQFPFGGDDDEADPDAHRIREQVQAVIRGDSPKR